MLIQRVTKIKSLISFIITFSLGQYLYAQKNDVMLTVCINNNARSNAISKSEFHPSFEYAVAHALEQDKLSSLALNTSWCKKNYTCYQAALPDKLIKKPVMILTPTHTTTEQPISIVSNYHNLTELFISRINSQRYNIKFTNFTHPHQQLNFDIKVRAQKWAVVDNKHGSALIRLDLKSS